MDAEPPQDRPAWTLSLEEWDALNADLEFPDRTPLTAAELAELRVRLDTPGGKQRPLTYREREARWKLGIIRSPEAVAELYDQVQRVRNEPRLSATSRDLAVGIVGALEWATGQVLNAPVSSTPAEERPPSVGQLSDEQFVAQDVAEGRKPTSRVGGRDHAVGVEHTIMWLLARTHQRPWPSPA